MKVILKLVWSGHKDPVVSSTKLMELANPGADFLLKRSKGKKHPDHILPEEAAKYGLEVTVEEIKPKGKVSKKETVKAEPVIETETINDPFDITDEEIPVPFTEQETEPKPKKKSKPVVKSKADLEAGI